mmetsp:Transcript_21805/g.60619  ORF Transcript_21805/g.60619 Transcript_21805/m.60619 type:complete len:399 (+) Transcript_21805:207-1403(+)
MVNHLTRLLDTRRASSLGKKQQRRRSSFSKSNRLHSNLKKDTSSNVKDKTIIDHDDNESEAEQSLLRCAPSPLSSSMSTELIDYDEYTDDGVDRVIVNNKSDSTKKKRNNKSKSSSSQTPNNKASLFRKCLNYFAERNSKRRVRSDGVLLFQHHDTISASEVFPSLSSDFQVVPASHNRNPTTNRHLMEEQEDDEEDEEPPMLRILQPSPPTSPPLLDQLQQLRQQQPDDDDDDYSDPTYPMPLSFHKAAAAAAAVASPSPNNNKSNRMLADEEEDDNSTISTRMSLSIPNHVSVFPEQQQQQLNRHRGGCAESTNNSLLSVTNWSVLQQDNGSNNKNGPEEDSILQRYREEPELLPLDNGELIPSSRNNNNNNANSAVDSLWSANFWMNALSVCQPF